MYKGKFSYHTAPYRTIYVKPSTARARRVEMYPALQIGCNVSFVSLQYKARLPYLIFLPAPGRFRNYGAHQALTIPPTLYGKVQVQ